MTAVETELDIELLVGALPAQSCDHELHNTERHSHADGDEWYVTMSVPCGCSNELHVYCGKYVQALTDLLNHDVRCIKCPAKFKVRDCFFPISPVKEIHK